jgi:hypothetical protein
MRRISAHQHSVFGDIRIFAHVDKEADTQEAVAGEDGDGPDEPDEGDTDTP